MPSVKVLSIFKPDFELVGSIVAIVASQSEAWWETSFQSACIKHGLSLDLQTTDHNMSVVNYLWQCLFLLYAPNICCRWFTAHVDPPPPPPPPFCCSSTELLANSVLRFLNIFLAHQRLCRIICVELETGRKREAGVGLHAGHSFPGHNAFCTLNHAFLKRKLLIESKNSDTKLHYDDEDDHDNNNDDGGGCWW